MTKTIDQRLAKVMADLFGVAPEEIKEASSPDSIPGWDSVTQLHLVAAVESEFGVQLTAQDAAEMLTFSLAREIIREHLRGD